MIARRISISMDSRIRFKFRSQDFENIYRKIYWALHPKEEIPELELRIVGSTEMQRANKSFRGKNRPTDVLSFHSQREDFLGSLMIDIQTARRQAKEFKHSPLCEIQELFVHGVLHLLNYDHERPQEAAAMAKLENHFNRLWKTTKRK